MRGFVSCILLAASVLFPAGSTPARAAEPERLIIRPAAGTFLEIEGRYAPLPGVCPAKQPRPLRAKYRGTLELVQRGSRIDIVNEIDFTQYLYGLAEVPTSWPVEALKAQVIAARSYALDAYRRGGARARARGYDICATDRCQVYRGATVELGAFGERWVAAVDATKRRVLTHGGTVIPAFYFSTSDGRTRRSFPGGTPQPYLPSVSGEDADAPLARWTARFPLGDLTQMLRRNGSWSGPAITRARASGDTVTFTGGTASRRISVADLRIALNNQATCIDSERYPTKGSAIGTRLPLAVPSSNYTLRQEGSAVVLRGRGWGHGVGMSQWGARSLAERGRTAEQILDYYYGAARITTTTEPGTIRVLAAERLKRIRISAEGSFAIESSTGSEFAPGSKFEVIGGSSLQIKRGRGPTLDPVLQVTARAIETATMIRFEISRPARVTVLTMRDGEIVARSPEQSFETGTHTAAIAPGGVPIPLTETVTLGIVVEAFDGLDRVRSNGLEFTLTPAESPSPSSVAAPEGPEGSNARGLVILIASGLALAGLAVLYVVSRRYRTMP